MAGAPATASGRAGVAAVRPGSTTAGTGGRRRTPLWAKLVLTVGVLLLLASGGTIVSVEVMLARYANNVEQSDLLGAAAAVEQGKNLEGPINLLLFGVDEQGDGVRADTIIVLHIPATHDQIYLISVPRDTWVDVPPYEPSGYFGGQSKINSVFGYGAQNGGDWQGGAQLVALTLHQLTGLRFNGAAIVNFDGFKDIIDELGGVEMCINDPAYSEHIVLVDGEPTGIGRARREGLYYEQVRYEIGCQHLAGWQALDYARQRKNLESGDGDYGRQRHQKQLLAAMADKATSRGVITNPGKLDGLLRAAGDALIVDTNDVPLIDFIFTLKGLATGDIISINTNLGEYNSGQVGDQSVEFLTPESLLMFQAAADDTMAEFLLNNPDFIEAPDNR